MKKVFGSLLIWAGTSCLLFGLLLMLGFIHGNDKLFLMLFFSGISLSMSGFLYDAWRMKPITRNQRYRRQHQMKSCIYCLLATFGMIALILFAHI